MKVSQKQLEKMYELNLHFWRVFTNLEETGSEILSSEVMKMLKRGLNSTEKLKNILDKVRGRNP